MQVMPAIDYSSHVTNAAAPAAAAASAPQTGAFGISFGDLLDVINPLQHIPVISTLYRHLTGDKIGTPEKIAGDTLYGGAIGFLTSLADSAFEAVTGKDVGDTMLALLTGDDAGSVQTAKAGASEPAAVTPANSLTVKTPGLTSLMSALSRKGVVADTAARAAFAYGKAVSLSTDAFMPQ